MRSTRSLARFRASSASSRRRGLQGLDIALDFAIQCSRDHPWIKEHPEWFDWRPDGTIKFAENPPKKYEDIVNVHFYRDAFPSIWVALRDVVLYWVDKGVKIFRVDNPHTKPFPFWEWLIREVHETHPEVIFLSEAFTRPKPMKLLAKLGFSQSYTYFTWRNTKQELTDYLTELTTGDMPEYFRPNFFVNTPDINPTYLQTSGRPGFQARLVLAATLACNYGLYSGFELCEARALPGKEEYLNSEKYEIRAWDWDREGNIKPDVALINRLRQAHPALQQFTNLRFYNAWNDHILYYGKATEDKGDFLLFAVNLDPHTMPKRRISRFRFGSSDFRTQPRSGCEDLVTGEHFTWTGKVQQMVLDPHRAALCDLAPHRPRGRRGMRSMRRLHRRDPGGASRCRGAARARPKRRRLVQGRHRLSASRQGLPRFERRRHRRFQGPDANARLRRSRSGSMSSGCCRSIRRRSRTTATTSPTIATSIRPMATWMTSRPSWTEAHRRGIRVLTELVINHTSDEHPWFQRARLAPKGSPERDFYVWSDTDERYAGTRIIFIDTEKSNWAWDPEAGAYYWHRFYSHQPDLNFDNEAVLEEIIEA